MIVVGDLHGTFRQLEKIIASTDEKIIIQVGDFGLGFMPVDAQVKVLNTLNEKLKFHNKYLYAIRGNHDDPFYWDNANSIDEAFTNMHLVPDYTVHVLEGQSILFVGGALSIDRKVRTEGKDYWKDEVFDYDEDKLNTQLMLHPNIDIVITHTAPHFCYPTRFNDLVFSYAIHDKSLLDELRAERLSMARMYDVICHKSRPGYWVYGHMHSSYTQNIDGTEFVLLNIGETIVI